MVRFLLIALALLCTGANWQKTPEVNGTACGSLGNSGDICYLRQTDAANSNILDTSKCDSVLFEISDKGASGYLQSCKDKAGTHGCQRVHEDASVSTAALDGTVGSAGLSYAQVDYLRYEGAGAPTSSLDPAIIKASCRKGR